MIDLRDVTVTTSAKIDSPDRLRNTILFLRYFETFFVNYEIIVVEQDTDSQLKSILSDRPGVCHYFLESRNCHSRSRNLNLGARLAERPYLLICDLDIFVPPRCIESALKKVAAGVDFVLPYNGVAVQIKKEAIDDQLDFKALNSKLPFFSKLHEVRPPQHEREAFEPLYGSALSDTVGGIMMCNRRQFFLAGGLNENMISFGYEEGEFYYRIQKLGYGVERLEDANCYHFEHARTGGSLKNNFYRSNQAEYERVRAMDAEELRRYANAGFKEIQLDTGYDLAVTNTPSVYMIKVQKHDRRKLSEICTVLLFEETHREDQRVVEEFLDYMENNFDDYLVYVIEGKACRLRSVLGRKYTQHSWRKSSVNSLSDEEVRQLCHVDRCLVEIYRFSDRFDPAILLSRYKPDHVLH